MQNRHHEQRRTAGLLAPCLGAALLLAACGGGSSADSAALASGAAGGSSTAATSMTFSIDAATLPADVATQQAQPAFHLAPVLLDAPGDVDVVDNTASARSAPHAQAIPAGAAALETRGLTVQAIEGAQRARPQAAPRVLADGTLAPAASTSVATTYTPAQIRAAYGLPPLPAAGAALSRPPAAAARRGPDDLHRRCVRTTPNALADLNAFSTEVRPADLHQRRDRRRPPRCRWPSRRPRCTFSAVYSTTRRHDDRHRAGLQRHLGAESKLDVQWAHAIAPLARIVLIEMPGAMSNSILGAQHAGQRDGRRAWSR